uniref:Response regulator receiver modulated diguanylate phosphodiesterase n=1 Tax=Rhodopseudomonas palustris (strain BisA53) TaxID=316055 RepID=Q07I46_RHOP5
MKLTTIEPEGQAMLSTFGRRRVAPRACILDRKPHLRTFLADTLEELRFVTSDCSNAGELPALLGAHQPDLLVLGSSIDGLEAARVIDLLADRGFSGHLLMICARDSIMSGAIRQLGFERGLLLLPTLSTPFSSRMLRECVAPLLPAEPAPKPAVDVAEALKAGWLELWYQRKVDARALTLCGAEALVRMRHPSWGVVAPAAFLPDGNDPHFRALSEFVLARAIEDWHYLLQRHGPVDLSINLPAGFLQNPQAVDDLCRWMPAHPGFGGLIVEIDAADAADGLAGLAEVARGLRFHNIGIAIDRVGADWPALMHLDMFPFVELKVDRQFVTGCADDRLKQTVCKRIVELARDYGARCTATGIESRADYVTAHQIGFDLVQGYLFGKPMAVQKFARSASSRPLRMAE